MFGRSKKDKEAAKKEKESGLLAEMGVGAKGEAEKEKKSRLVVGFNGVAKVGFANAIDKQELLKYASIALCSEMTGDERTRNRLALAFMQAGSVNNVGPGFWKGQKVTEVVYDVMGAFTIESEEVIQKQMENEFMIEIKSTVGNITHITYRGMVCYMMKDHDKIARTTLDKSHLRMGPECINCLQESVNAYNRSKSGLMLVAFNSKRVRIGSKN